MGRLSCNRHALASSIQGALQEADPLLAKTETAMTLGNTMAKKADLGLHCTGLTVLRGYQWLSLIRPPRWKGKGLLGLGTRLTD